MDRVLGFLGLSGNSGLIVIGLAFSSGLIVASTMVAIGAVVPFTFKTPRRTLSSLLATVTIVGSIAVLASIVFLIRNGTAIAPILLFGGLGLLLGPLLAQALERSSKSSSVVLSAVIVVQGATLAAVDRYFL